MEETGNQARFDIWIARTEKRQELTEPEARALVSLLSARDKALGERVHQGFFEPGENSSRYDIREEEESVVSAVLTREADLSDGNLAVGLRGVLELLSE